MFASLTLVIVSSSGYFRVFGCHLQPYESGNPSTTPPSYRDHGRSSKSWHPSLHAFQATELIIATANHSADGSPPLKLLLTRGQPISCVWKHRQCPGWNASTFLADELLLTIPPCPRVSRDKQSALRINCFFLRSGGLRGQKQKHSKHSNLGPLLTLLCGYTNLS